jgi:anti-sigma factor RsiW
MTHSTPDDKSVLLVHAYLDGELDPANALGIEQQMGTDPALAAEGERVKALQRLIHERLPREDAPPNLHARIEGSVGGLRRQRAQPSWRALAASIALTAMVASGSTWFMVGSQQPNMMIADVLVSDHIRALMAPEPVDVVSSDRHTVKPWFNDRIANSPRVVDLAKQDFPLVGGRMDVIGQTLSQRWSIATPSTLSASPRCRPRAVSTWAVLHAPLMAITSYAGLRTE